MVVAKEPLVTTKAQGAAQRLPEGPRLVLTPQLGPLPCSVPAPRCWGPRMLGPPHLVPRALPGCSLIAPGSRDPRPWPPTARIPPAQPSPAQSMLGAFVRLEASRKLTCSWAMASLLWASASPALKQAWCLLLGLSWLSGAGVMMTSPAAGAEPGTAGGSTPERGSLGIRETRLRRTCFKFPHGLFRTPGGAG